jgi:hypothetical protein
MAATLRGAADAAPKIAPGNFLFFAHIPMTGGLVPYSKTEQWQQERNSEYGTSTLAGGL